MWRCFPPISTSKIVLSPLLLTLPNCANGNPELRHCRQQHTSWGAASQNLTFVSSDTGAVPTQSLWAEAVGSKTALGRRMKHLGVLAALSQAYGAVDAD